MTRISGNIVDVLRRRIYPGTVILHDGVVTDIVCDNRTYPDYILPGFVDAHVHIESSMLVPSEFARLACVHGTVATVSDPHEIANVLGVRGVAYMIENGAAAPFKFFFGAPSCVPASPFETSGAVLDQNRVASLLADKKIHYLSEVMNFPGVISGDTEVRAKISAARKLGKPVDGHAPGLRGEDLVRYCNAGITTDHETMSYGEGEEKISLGMKVMIREGSAARNFDELFPLIPKYPGMTMLCSDDKHPDDLAKGHINRLVARAVARGVDVMDALRCACVNPVAHYGLEVGLLRKGDPADLIVVGDLKDFSVRKTYIGGRLTAENGLSLIPRAPIATPNVFATNPKRIDDFVVKARGSKMNVIVARDRNLATGWVHERAKVLEGSAVSDTSRDILKISVVNRYADAPPSLGFIRNFGLRAGAIASSVAHDSHNVIAVGVHDEAICRAVNAVIAARGGLAVNMGTHTEVLPLPVAGIMSDMDGTELAKRYQEIQGKVSELGCGLQAPFMTLSFMGLTVIPELKLSDRGLFDGKLFRIIDLFE